jgi:hypothetical protein
MAYFYRTVLAPVLVCVRLLPKLPQPFSDLSFIAQFPWLVVAPSLQFIGQVLLAHVVAGVVVGIFVPFAMTESPTIAGGVLQMVRQGP